MIGRDTMICVTQAQIDEYSGPKPDSHAGCQITDIRKHEGGSSAKITCGPPMTEKGTIEMSWIDSRHSKTKSHFIATMQAGPTPRTLEWTIETESTFQSPDCGNVKSAPQ